MRGGQPAHEKSSLLVASADMNGRPVSGLRCGHRQLDGDTSQHAAQGQQRFAQVHSGLRQTKVAGSSFMLAGALLEHRNGFFYSASMLEIAQ